MKISVVGLGYMGLPTAAVLASHQVTVKESSARIEVIGVDVNQHMVDTISQGRIHIVEPELDTLVRGAVQAGYLRAVTQPEKADAFMVTVPTPFKGNYEPDL